MNNEPKQVIILRKDLNMRKGKMIAQGAHASMKVIIEAQNKARVTGAMREWLEGRFTKIVVSVSSEQELRDIHLKAKCAGLPCSLVQDAGLTEFKEPTFTAVAIGPDYPDKIDPITGGLSLL